jgi:hypothetical protein
VAVWAEELLRAREVLLFSKEVEHVVQ